MDNSSTISRIVEISRFMYERKYVSSRNGNVSALNERGEVLITPASSCIGYLDPSDIVEVDLEGVRLHGKHNPSLELPFHLAVYRSREDVRAVVHAHPPYLTAFSLVGRIPYDDILPEFVVSVGSVEFIPFAMPGSPELASTVSDAVCNVNALVLSNHGAITVGMDVDEAFMRMEDLEHAAKVQFIAERLGEIAHISEEEIVLLREFVKGVEGN
jgi:L-fuculose-phosphate aldolase